MNAREKLVELLTEFYGSDPVYYGVDALAIAEHLIGNDVKPVVRCKDCKYYEIHKPKVLENCERNGYIIPMKPDDFCSYGERKDGDGNG